MLQFNLEVLIGFFIISKLENKTDIAVDRKYCLN